MEFMYNHSLSLNGGHGLFLALYKALVYSDTGNYTQ